MSLPLTDIPSGSASNVKDAVLTANFRKIMADSIVRVYKNANGDTFTVGKLASGDYGITATRGGVPNILIDGTGIKVAKDGIDVNTATNDQLVMSSEFNSLKLADEGTEVITHPANTAFHIETIPHNLGVRPIIMAFATAPAGDSKPLPNLVFGFADGTIDHAQEIQSIGLNDFTFRSFVRQDQPDAPFPSTTSLKWYAFIETAE